MNKMKSVFLTITVSTIALAQAVPALAFSRHKQSSLCQMIVSQDASQEKINQKIQDAGNLKGATCLNDYYDNGGTPRVPILSYAVSRGISNEDYTPGSNVASFETIENLVKSGADVNAADGSGSESLYLTLGTPDLAMFLLQNGAKPTSDTFAKQVRTYNTSASLPVLMQLLEMGAGQPDLILNTLSPSDDASWLAVEEAISTQYPHATLFDESAAYSFMTYGTWALLSSKLNWMVEHGLRFDVIGAGQTMTAFDYCLTYVTSDTIKNLDLIEGLAKVTVTASDLTIAAANGEATFNHVLATYPIDPSLTGKSITPLSLAIARNFSIATINQLLAAKPDLSVEGTTEPTTVLATAATISTPDVLTALIAAGANVSQVSSINHQTAFMAAVAASKEQNALLLLPQSQSMMNAQNIQGLSPLMIAAQTGNTNLVAIISGVAGVNLEEQDPNGRTALFYAVDIGSESTVLELLSHGACLQLKDKNGVTPLSLSNSDNPYGYDQNHTAISNDLQTYLNQAGHC